MTYIMFVILDKRMGYKAAEGVTKEYAKRQTNQELLVVF